MQLKTRNKEKQKKKQKKKLHLEKEIKRLSLREISPKKAIWD